MLNTLVGKVAVVTGAANGIGLAISQGFAERGATVVMTDIDNDKLHLEKDLLLRDYDSVDAVTCDVGCSDSVKQMAKQVLRDHSQIDVLVNNAAVAIPGNIVSMSEADWSSVINTNLSSVYRTIQAFLPSMLTRKSGSVINISSVQASRSWRNWTAYATAKGGIRSMTIQLAGQFGDMNVRFNTITPGAILTPMNENRAKEEGEAFLAQSKKMSPASRLGRTSEVASAAVFLASDDAAFVNGADIKVDGGLSTVPRYEEHT